MDEVDVFPYDNETLIRSIEVDVYELDGFARGLPNETVYIPRHQDIGARAESIQITIETGQGPIEVGGVVGAKYRVFGTKKSGSNVVGVVDATQEGGFQITSGCGYGDHFQVRTYYDPKLKTRFIVSYGADGLTTANLTVWKEWLQDNPQVVKEIAENYGPDILRTLNPDILFSRIMSSSGRLLMNSLDTLNNFRNIARPKMNMTNDLFTGIPIVNRLQQLQAGLVRNITASLRDQRQRWGIPYRNWVNGVYCLQIFAVPDNGDNIAMISASSFADTFGITSGDISSLRSNFVNSNGPIDELLHNTVLSALHDTWQITDNKADHVYGTAAYPNFPAFITASYVPIRDNPWMRLQTDGITDVDVLGSRGYHPPEEICRTLNSRPLPDDIALVDVGFPGGYY